MAVFEENSNRTETKVFPCSLDMSGSPGWAIFSILDGHRYIRGDLILRDTHLDILPDQLFVEGDLDFTNSCIEELPDGLAVGGDLYLVRSRLIHELPDNLYVGGDLYIVDSSLNGQKLPENISIDGHIIDSNYLYSLGGEKS